MPTAAARRAPASAALVAAASVNAQTAAPSNNENVPVSSDPAAQTPAAASDGQDIVVTGTRIRRPDFDLPNPTISLDIATIRQAGTINVVDFLVRIPAFQGSTTSADTAGSTVPSDLIRRIDVPTGGASAIYGADAVTGVVTFILRKDFEGHRRSRAGGYFGIWRCGQAADRGHGRRELRRRTRQHRGCL